VPLREDWSAAGSVAVLVLALGWWWAAAVTARTAPRRVAGWATGVAVATTGVYLSPALAPMTAATWFAFGLAFPRGELVTVWRRTAVAGALVLGGGASAVLAGSEAGSAPSWTAVLVWASVAGGAGAAIAVRAGRVDRDDRARCLLIGAAAGLGTAVAGGAVALSLLVSVPRTPGPWAVGALVLLPVATAAGWLSARARRSADRLFVESVAVGGTALLTGAVYLVVVVGLGRAPDAGERSVLGLSLVAAVVLAVLALPVRHRLLALGAALVGDRAEGAERVLTGFGARMSRAIPMDELLLQLVESLHGSIAPGGAEVWVGDDGALSRTAAVPHRPSARIDLDQETLRVVAAARIGGRAWASVWLPWLVRSETDTVPGAGVGDAGRPDLRVVPLAHLGQLRGLLVVRGAAGAGEFAEDSEALLVDLGRQLGLALHNVGLDSALQASLTELEQRNAELQASRLRIVTAADESRRTIERNLHDGAQQHLVALAVKLGVAAELVDDDPDALRELLTDLRSDVSVTIGELRSLAHGIYPPLLRERGLGEALRAAALRSPLATRVTGTLPGRMAAEVEAAAYFCCLEAMQNSAKHAGADATVEVSLGWCEGELSFEVRDDGVGFEPATHTGHGFENMTDRVGALSGSLQVVSSPGGGTSVRGSIPAPLLPGPSTPAPSSGEPVAASGS
jgi:signal transduction histidine kinase